MQSAVLVLPTIWGVGRCESLASWDGSGSDPSSKRPYGDDCALRGRGPCSVRAAGGVGGGPLGVPAPEQARSRVGTAGLPGAAPKPLPGVGRSRKGCHCQAPPRASFGRAPEVLCKGLDGVGGRERAWRAALVLSPGIWPGLPEAREGAPRAGRGGEGVLNPRLPCSPPAPPPSGGPEGERDGRALPSRGAQGDGCPVGAPWRMGRTPPR